MVFICDFSLSLIRIRCAIWTLPRTLLQTQYWFNVVPRCIFVLTKHVCWQRKFTAQQHSDRRNNLAIITSEPLTDRRADWMPVPEQVRFAAICNMVVVGRMRILFAIAESRPSQVFSGGTLSFDEQQHPNGSW